MVLFADCIIIDKTKVNKIFTYLVKDLDKRKAQVGKRVIIPFGRSNKLDVAMIVNLKKEFNCDYKLKEVVEIIDEQPIVSSNSFKIASFIANWYLLPITTAFNYVLPPTDLKNFERVYIAGEYEIDFSSEVFQTIKERGCVSETDLLKAFDSDILKKELEVLCKKGYIRSKLSVVKKIARKTRQLVILKSFDWREHISTRSQKKALVCEYLEARHEGVLIDELVNDLKVSKSVIKNLFECGIIAIEHVEEYRRPRKWVSKSQNQIVLNIEQRNVINGIENSSGKFHLIHGVTGCGKTEIYLNIAKNVVNNGQSVIYLVPEIGLTPQTVARVTEKFGERVAVIHSGLSLGERLDEWTRIRNGEVDVVVGVRSAIFAPVENLGLIIIDEEHDTSYKSMLGLRYNALEVARFRAVNEGCKLILGSATPGIDSYYYAQKGLYRLWELKNRALNTKLPYVSVVDMREELEAGNVSVFSRELRNKINYNLLNKRQSILFINNRGYANFISCRNCGYIDRCESCDVSMTYHKSVNKMICHYCGRVHNVPIVCPVCKKSFPYIKPFGAGTQMVEEKVKNEFPTARVQRFDADTATSKNYFADELKKVADGNIDILVGTQMIAKGHDFPKVKLSAIIAADSLINFPDYRATERSFQLITQVVGRAGRSDEVGEAVIQAYQPDHYVINYALNNDYAGFYNEEISLRKRFNYPPFVKLVKLEVSGKNEVETSNMFSNFCNALKMYADDKLKLGNTEFIGPYPSQIAFVNNCYKFYLLIKASNDCWEKLVSFVRGVYLENNRKFFDTTVNRDIYFDPEGIN